MTVSMEDVIRQIKGLPTLPEVVFDVLKTLGQENADLGFLTNKISLDPPMTANVLRLANSAYYKTSSKVGTLQQAMNLIGFSGVRNLVLTVALKGYFQNASCEGFDSNAFWRHSMATAVCAKVIARQGQFNQDYAYTAGLLHDIGTLVLVVYFTREYEQVLARVAETDCHILEAEQAVLGIDHAVVGVMLAKEWKLPEDIQNAIASHHALDIPGGDDLPAIVHVADAVSHALDFPGDERDMVPPLSAAAWDALAFSENTGLRLFHEMEAEFEAVKRSFPA